MAKPDWFRKTSWSPGDQADFRARLTRSRANSRAQYLRLQAYHLQEVGTAELVSAALTLLDELIATYPDSSDLASAHLQRGQCLADLGRHEDALAAYRCAFEAQRQRPNVRTDVRLTFGELILALHRADLYPEALERLDEFAGYEVFPAELYRLAAIRALIADAQGEPGVARDQAQRALDAAGRTESPFRYHRKLGLVRQVDPEVHQRLSALSAT
jgi:tetratricopeptide (TPR) repeat protein